MRRPLCRREDCRVRNALARAKAILSAVNGEGYLLQLLIRIGWSAGRLCSKWLDLELGELGCQRRSGQVMSLEHVAEHHESRHITLPCLILL